MSEDGIVSTLSLSQMLTIHLKDAEPSALGPTLTQRHLYLPRDKAKVKRGPQGLPWRSSD